MRAGEFCQQKNCFASGVTSGQSGKRPSFGQVRPSAVKEILVRFWLVGYDKAPQVWCATNLPCCPYSSSLGVLRKNANALLPGLIRLPVGKGNAR
jgi:hypothetical protein